MNFTVLICKSLQNLLQRNFRTKQRLRIHDESKVPQVCIASVKNLILILNTKDDDLCDLQKFSFRKIRKIGRKGISACD